MAMLSKSKGASKPHKAKGAKEKDSGGATERRMGYRKGKK